MNTSPSIDDLLAGAIDAITDDLMPSLANAKAYATAMMLQSVLQGVRQMLPVMDARLVDEHNDMTRTLRDVVVAIDEVSGDAADAVRRRGATLGQWSDLPAPADREAIIAAHRELGNALVATISDLDVLQRAGEAAADEALQIVRGHFGPRYLRDVETFVVGARMLGRG